MNDVLFLPRMVDLQLKMRDRLQRWLHLATSFYDRADRTPPSSSSKATRELKVVRKWVEEKRARIMLVHGSTALAGRNLDVEFELVAATVASAILNPRMLVLFH